MKNIYSFILIVLLGFPFSLSGQGCEIIFPEGLTVEIEITALELSTTTACNNNAGYNFNIIMEATVTNNTGGSLWNIASENLECTGTNAGSYDFNLFTVDDGQSETETISTNNPFSMLDNCGTITLADMMCEEISFSVTGANIDNSGSCSLGALPIELLSFKAEHNNQHVSIRWQTVSEINHSFFRIEKSDDLINWHEIYQEESKGGDSYTLKNYSYIDNNPYSEENYYRLMQVDNDGSTSFSPVRTVVLDNRTDAISYFPNPASDQIVLKSDKGIHSKIQVVDMLGKVLDKKLINSNLHEVQLDVSDLTTGVYFIQYDNKSYKFYKL